MGSRADSCWAVLEKGTRRSAGRLGPTIFPGALPHMLVRFLPPHSASNTTLVNDSLTHHLNILQHHLPHTTEFDRHVRQCQAPPEAIYHEAYKAVMRYSMKQSLPFCPLTGLYPARFNPLPQTPAAALSDLIIPPLTGLHPARFNPLPRTSQLPCQIWFFHLSKACIPPGLILCPKHLQLPCQI